MNIIRLTTILFLALFSFMAESKNPPANLDESLGKQISLTIFTPKEGDEKPIFDIYVGVLNRKNGIYFISKENKGNFRVPNTWLTKITNLNPSYKYLFGNSDLMLLITKSEYIEAGFKYSVSSKGEIDVVVEK